MRNKKRLGALLLAGVMGILTGCGSQAPAKDAVKEAQSAQEVETSESQETEVEAGQVQETEDPFLAGEKPELNILYYSQGYDMNEDPAKKIMEDITGYKVTYHSLPTENADEKMMLEIASGADYDLIYRAGTAAYAQLNEKNALMDISELLDKYGSDIKENVSDFAWSLVTDGDVVTGIPRETAKWDPSDLRGVITGGIAFRSDMLEELGMGIPSNLDEFYEVLSAYKEKTGNAPLTTARGAWIADIMSAFGMGSTDWYLKDGQMIHRIQCEGFKDYIAYMQMLYKEGLLDNDMPINAAENAKEKFANNTALCTSLAFWDIPSIKDALSVSNPDAKVVFATCLGKDADNAGFLAKTEGLDGITVIPKNSKNPEHAMIWYNLISQIDNYRAIYIGEENVSYEIKDGAYYPIFPAFSEYQNSDKYTGSGPAVESGQMWQARARKTPEMAEAYDQMNANANSYRYYSSVESYAQGLPAMKEYYPFLREEINDILIKGIVSEEDDQTIVDEIFETWEREGGKECEDAMQKWYEENKQYFE